MKKRTPPPRVFAKHGKETRFLVSHDGATVHAQVIHVDLHMVNAEIDMRAFWHSAGAVPVRDIQTAAKYQTAIRFMHRGRCSHSVEVIGAHLAQLLVALDQWTEAGGKVTRKPKVIT